MFLAWADSAHPQSVKDMKRNLSVRNSDIMTLQHLLTENCSTVRTPLAGKELDNGLTGSPAGPLPVIMAEASV